MRLSTVLFALTQRLLYTKWRDPGEEPKLHLFGQLKRITKEWLDSYLECKGGTYPAQLLYQELADMACDRITAAITRPSRPKSRSKRFSIPTIPKAQPTTCASTLERIAGKPAPSRCHINWVILDSDWEGEFCRVAESHPKVRAYVKNQASVSKCRTDGCRRTAHTSPDFIVHVDDGHGETTCST